MTTRTQIVAAARDWLGTPFHHQGRLKGVGVDCAGLVICVAREFALIPASWNPTGYSRAPDGATLMAYCLEQMQPISQSEMQAGDVVVVRFDNYPQHLGIVGDYRHGGHSIIHASGNSGQVIETRLMFHAAMLYVASFRLPGVHP
jgi:cell wall-associated NlpC family hydrolase